MNTAAEFLIRDSRFGEAELKRGTPQAITAVAIEIFRPLRDSLATQGFVAGPITKGKPWGCGCDLKMNESRVSVFFFPVPSEKEKRWEGSIHIIPSPPLWHRIFHLREKTSEEKLALSVAEALKPMLSQCHSFSGVRWIPLNQLYASRGYEGG